MGRPKGNDMSKTSSDNSDEILKEIKSLRQELREFKKVYLEDIKQNQDPLPARKSKSNSRYRRDDVNYGSQRKSKNC